MKATSKFATRRARQTGFTLIEMLMATAIVIVGLVAVAQLVPSSVLLNSNNRNDGTALVFAQREMELIREQPLTATYFTDPLGVFCPSGNQCLLGDATQPNQLVGSPVVLFENSPVIDYTAAQVPNYSFTYSDRNDPAGTTTDVRWAVVTNKNSWGVVISRRIILGVFRRGMSSLTFPVTLDVVLEK